MIKYINKKKYDTETAKLIGKNESQGVAHSDINYCYYELYKKRGGEYFSLQGNWEIGNGFVERIIPLSFSEAQQFAETFLDSKDYEKEFGDTDKNSKETVVIVLKKETRRKLYRLSDESGKQLSEIIEELISNA